MDDEINIKITDMKRKQELLDQISLLEEQINPLKKELTAIYKKEADDIKAKIHDCYMLEDKFTTEDLIFAATARCSCGAGFAYPKEIDIHGSWYCSAILLGNAPGGSSHDGPKSFATYEIKSEGQSSADGQTTRP